MGQGISVAVLGAAGLNGENLLQLLAQRDFPCSDLLPLDNDASLGRKVEFGDRLISLESYDQADFHPIDLAVVCEPLPAELISRIREQGATLIAPVDSLPDEDIEPVVANLNMERLPLQKGMAIPLPSAASTVLAGLLSPLQDELGLLAINAAWTRAVSNQGRDAVGSLAAETAQLLNGKRPKPGHYPQPIAFNLLTGDVDAEERAFRDLWHTLWGEDGVGLSINTIIAPLFFGDIVSITIETEQSATVGEVDEILSGIGDSVRAGPGLPVPLSAADTANDAMIRLSLPRQCDEQGRRFSWLAAMDLPKVGLALNQVKIAENLAKNLFISYS